MKYENKVGHRRWIGWIHENKTKKKAGVFGIRLLFDAYSRAGKKKKRYAVNGVVLLYWPLLDIG